MLTSRQTIARRGGCWEDASGSILMMALIGQRDRSLSFASGCSTCWLFFAVLLWSGWFFLLWCSLRAREGAVVGPGHIRIKMLFKRAQTCGELARLERGMCGTPSLVALFFSVGRARNLFYKTEPNLLMVFSSVHHLQHVSGVGPGPDSRTDGTSVKMVELAVDVRNAGRHFVSECFFFMRMNCEPCFHSKHLPRRATHSFVTHHCTTRHRATLAPPTRGAPPSRGCSNTGPALTRFGLPQSPPC